MDILQRTENLLVETERNLAGLANEAGVARDYDQATSLIELARKVKELAELFRRSASENSATANPPDTGAVVQPAVRNEIPIRSRSKLGRYPRFLREGDNLVKIGWSKSETAEYEHKSPKRVVALLCDSLTGTNGKRITMENVLPLTDPANGSPIPDYQAYLCLAWLRSAGLVNQHGRQGYSVPKGVDLEKSVEAQWANLLTR